MNLIEWPYYKSDFLVSQGFSKTIVFRFWQKVSIGNGCWIWNAARTKFGYGRIGTFRGTASGYTHAHRVSWIIHNGPIPKETPNVLHHCDNPCCVRPDHLWLGTHKQNSRDCINKGRNGHKTHPGCNARKLTPDMVQEIRNSYNPYITTHPDLAKKFGVSKTVIGHILRNNLWKHLPNTPHKTRTKGFKLYPATVAIIREQYASGKFTQLSLAKLHGVSKAMIWTIIKRKWWKNV